MDDVEMAHMLADYMERGFLGNIEDMFRHDVGLYRHVPSLMSSPQGRVRIGTVALVESLRQEHAAQLPGICPQVAALLDSPAPELRADAAYLLSIIGGPVAHTSLTLAHSREPHAAVRDVMSECIEDMQGAGQ